ncbi:MAG: metal ABC transporter substrate-binding protein [Candidatus Gastranaerophilaceae bacterium]|jgi:zinc transport system substrate-binding protein
MNLKYVGFWALVLVCLMFTGCNNNKDIRTKTSDKNLVIVTSFYPVYISTINVTKDIPNVKVIDMTKPQTGCLHDYSVTPDDLKTLEKAKIFVINGAGMENFLSKIIKQQPDLKIVDASRGIELLRDKKNGEPNPHLWVSISNTMLQVNNIAEQLVKYDPNNAVKYRKNAAEYIVKLKTERAKMHKVIDKLKNRNIITFHEAFPYFAKEFNLNIVDIIEREPGSEPSAKELKNTIDIVKKDKVKALFAEPQYSAKAAQTIAGETEAKVYILDPAVIGELKDDAYIKIMDNNLKSLQEALK